jgi:hypothetical protein
MTQQILRLPELVGIVRGIHPIKENDKWLIEKSETSIPRRP